MLFGGGGLRGGRKEGGGGLLVGLFMVMERPAEEKVDGWKGEGRKGTGGLTIREKFRPVKVSFLPIVLLIKTAPAPELIEGLSLSLTPLPLPPSSVLLAHPADSLCGGEKEKRIRKKKKSEGHYQCTIMVLPSTSHSAAINIAPITVKGTRLGQDDNEHILSSPAEELKYTQTDVNTRKHTHVPTYIKCVQLEKKIM